MGQSVMQPFALFKGNTAIHPHWFKQGQSGWGSLVPRFSEHMVWQGGAAALDDFRPNVHGQTFVKKTLFIRLLAKRRLSMVCRVVFNHEPWYHLLPWD